jgi:class 3 adenylate cyclase/tetratricopeptide (TPR) repeat protein
MTSSTATVLFTDLVGSTELMTRLGDVAFDRLRGEHFAQLRDALAAHGGTEVKNTGDGILATFASAVQALAAAVGMQQAVDGQARSADAPLAIRVGLSLGEVTLEDGDVFGTPVVEAARLVAAARPGQILAAAVVRMVAGSRAPTAITDIGALELKGLPEPLAACEVAWEPAQSPAAAMPLPPALTAAGRIFVGREDELQALRQRWKEANVGERRLVLLGGEPGVGKTRLATELAGSLHREGALVLAGRCDEDLGVPYQPLVEALRHYLAHSAAPRLGRHAGELVRLVPELAQMVAGLPEQIRSDPETERYRLFDAVASWLADVSTGAPVLLVLDDLQWAAKPTLLLLRHVLRSPEPLHLLVVATYRDTDIGRGHPLAELLADVPRLPEAERRSLMGLDVPAVAAFVEQAVGHELDEEGDELARVVWRETEGNAFFVGEVLRHLRESRALEERDGRWELTAAIDDLGIPEGVRDVVGRRLSRLSEEANRILACASVVGVEFEPALIQAAGGFSEEAVLAAVEQAVAGRLLVDVPGPVPRNRFAHALVRATLYDELTAARRVALHRHVAESIEARFAGYLDDQLPALAHHWALAAAPAAETDRAIDYATRAGDRALAQLAHDEAATYYGSALELLDASPATVDTSRRLALLLSLGEAQRRAGDPAHRRTLIDAAMLAQQLGDADALARAALANCRGHLSTAWNTVAEDKIAALQAALGAIGGEDTPQRARLLATSALELLFDTDAWERRVALSDEALTMARRLGDADTLVTVLVARYISTMPSAVAGRLSDSSELVEAAQSVADPFLRSQAWGTRYRALMEAGEVEEADRCLDRAAALAADLGQPALRWAIAYCRAGRAVVGARFDEGERFAAEARELGVATGQEGVAVSAAQRFLVRLAEGTLDAETEALLGGISEHRLPLFDIWEVLLCCELGREADARRRLADLRPAIWPDQFPRDLSWLCGLCSWAGVAANLGDAPLAADVHRLLLPYVDHALTLAVLPMPAVVHHLGLLATTLGHYGEADERFEAAAAIHQRLGAPAWLARTQLEWARMLTRRGNPGDTDRARQMAGDALTTAEGLGMAGVVAGAREVIAGA